MAKLVARMEEVGIDDEMGAGELRITRAWESGPCAVQSRIPASLFMPHAVHAFTSQRAFAFSLAI